MKYRKSKPIIQTKGSFDGKVNLKKCQNEMYVHLSILLIAANGAKLIGPHGGLQVDKPKVGKVTGSVDAPLSNISVTVSCVTDKRFYRGHSTRLSP